MADENFGLASCRSSVTTFFEDSEIRRRLVNSFVIISHDQFCKWSCALDIANDRPAHSSDLTIWPPSKVAPASRVCQPSTAPTSTQTIFL